MFLLAAALALSSASMNPFDAGAHPLLMRHPTMSRTQIVFAFSGDLWSVPRSGGDAHRITSNLNGARNPFFSPDGESLAFSANYDGNTDVYVMPAKGGFPKRLTSHPAEDLTEGWSPDGKSVLFSSSMLSNTDHPRLFTVPATEDCPRPFPSLPAPRPVSRPRATRSLTSPTANGKKLGSVTGAAKPPLSGWVTSPTPE